MAVNAIKILVLGSGMVARPCVEYLLRDPNNIVTIGKKTLTLYLRDHNLLTNI